MPSSHFLVEVTSWCHFSHSRESTPMESVTAAASRELLKTLASRFDAITISSNFFPFWFHPCWPRQSTNHLAMVLQLTGSPSGYLPFHVQILKCFFNLQHLRFVGFGGLCVEAQASARRRPRSWDCCRCVTRFSGCCANFIKSSRVSSEVDKHSCGMFSRAEMFSRARLKMLRVKTRKSSLERDKHRDNVQWLRS